MTEGEFTTLNNLSEMGEGRRQGQPCLDQSGSRSEAADLLLLGDWLMDQMLARCGQGGNGSCCRETTSRQEGFMTLTRLCWCILDSCSCVAKMHREEEEEEKEGLMDTALCFGSEAVIL